MASRSSTQRASARKRSQRQKVTEPSTATIPVAKIVPCAANAREDFGDLDDLAKSIAAVGLLEPIIVRPAKAGKYELVAGERRLKAVKLLKWKEIPATVRELSDREAAEVRLLENLDRKTLNPIEEAGALRQLAELGHDAGSLAELTRWTQESITGRLGLLELSDEWQALLKAGELSPAAAEYLVPFADRPAVLDAMLKVARNRWPLPLVEWRRLLNETVVALTRSLEPDDPTGPRFELTEDRLSRLEPIDLELSPRQTVKRTFAVAYWDELQDQADEQAAQRAAAVKSAQPDPPQRPPRSGNRHPSPAGNGQPIPRDPSRNGRSRGTSLADVMREYKAEWLRELLTARLEKMDLDGLQDLADVLAIDVAAEWQINRRFLEFLDEAELRELGAELSVDVSTCRDEGECVALLLHQQPTQVPRILIEA